MIAVFIYGTALGGIFGLTFAYAYGCTGVTSPRTLSALMAAISFVTIVLVPTLKYPANPPSVGNPGIIGMRTAAFFLMLAFFHRGNGLSAPDWPSSQHPLWSVE